ncbi:MAG: BACON domain-containing protein [Alistipes sp.]|nr:BACON domain-containing protein [Alistipes sp.]
MKNLFTRLMLVAVAAMGFVACQEGYEDVTITPEAKEIVMTFVAEAPETRTSVAIDGKVAKYSWSEGDKVGFYYVAPDVDYKKKVNSDVAVIAADSTATFTASFTPIDGVSSYNIGAFYPGNSWVNASHATEYPFNNVKVKISNEQALTNGSFDPAADLMMSKPFMGVELNAETVNTLEFTRIAAIGKMNLKLNGMEEGEVIKSVKFTLAKDTNFNGPVVLDLENSTYVLGTTGTSNYVNLTGSLAANADRTAIFFTCFPGEYSGAYTIEVETDKATYSKEDTLKTALVFTAGDVLNFNATVDDRTEVEIPTDVYTLLKDVKELNAGDKIIIAAAADYNVALSTTQNSNNRGQASITKSEDRSTISYGADVQILTVEAGTKEGTFAFNTGSGYLYAASSGSNYLRTEKTLSDNSSWTIEVDSSSVATIKAQGANTRNWLRYNSSSSIFSCYSSGQQDVAIYHLDGDYLTVSTDTISFTAEGGKETFTVSKNFDASVSVTCDNSLFTITSDDYVSYTVTAPKNETTEEITGTITVTAGEFTKTIAITQKAAATADENTVTYTFSDYAAGTQYAEGEVHKLDEVLTITTTQCHFTTQLRIYSSDAHDGYAIGKLADGNVIKSLGFNAGNNADTLNVYGSTDGSTWTLIKGISVTSAYKDYTVDFGDTNYTSFKLDVAGSKQIRLQSLTLTYIPSAE